MGGVHLVAESAVTAGHGFYIHGLFILTFVSVQHHGSAQVKGLAACAVGAEGRQVEAAEALERPRRAHHGRRERSQGTAGVVVSLFSCAMHTLVFACLG